MVERYSDAAFAYYDTLPISELEYLHKQAGVWGFKDDEAFYAEALARREDEGE